MCRIGYRLQSINAARNHEAAGRGRTAFHLHTQIELAESAAVAKCLAPICIRDSFAWATPKYDRRRYVIVVVVGRSTNSLAG